VFSLWRSLLNNDSIVEKLTELGWEEDVNKLPDRHTAQIHKLTHFEDHPLVKQPKPLTDRSKAFNLLRIVRVHSTLILNSLAKHPTQND
jgi:hypothetical protein